MKLRWRGLGLDAEVVCLAQDDFRNHAGEYLDPRPLRPRLLELLDWCRSRLSASHERSECRVAVTIQARPIVSYYSGPRAEGKRVEERLCGAVVEVAKVVYETSVAAVEPDTVYSAYLMGRQLGGW